LFSMPPSPPVARAGTTRGRARAAAAPLGRCNAARGRDRGERANARVAVALLLLLLLRLLRDRVKCILAAAPFKVADRESLLYCCL
jgi:hypothetical protein